MNFYSIRDLRTETKSICDHIQSEGEAVITNNGKPTVLMLDISEDFGLRFYGDRRTVLGVVVAEAAVASRIDSSLLYGFHSLSCSEQSGWDWE